MPIAYTSTSASSSSDFGCGVIQVESNTRLILYDDQAEVILRTRAVDELRERLPRFLDLDRHTGTRIENHNQCNGLVYTGEISYDLGSLVIQHGEVCRLQSSNSSIRMIKYRDIHQH